MTGFTSSWTIEAIQYDPVKTSNLKNSKSIYDNVTKRKTIRLF
jgi:hypothetical protein